MTINILAGAEEIGRAIKRYLVHVMGFRGQECNILVMGKKVALSREILNAHLWLIDAWNPFKPKDPEGFRTACNQAGKARCVLLFYDVPAGFPDEGSFWCNPLNCKLSKKIEDALRASPPEREEFEELIKLWPALAYEPKDHHHHHH